MLIMRPADADDQDPIARMIRARSAWLKERGFSDWDAAVDGLAQAAIPGFRCRSSLMMAG